MSKTPTRPSHPVRFLSVLVSLLLVAALAPPAGAQEVEKLTLTGPTTTELSQPHTYSGVLTASGVGAPLQDVNLLVDGVVAATDTTANDGTYEKDLAFSSYGSHEVQAVAHRGTPLEVRSEVLTVETVPPIDDNEATDFHEATEFIYTGPDALQTGLDPQTIVPRRAAVVRGTVTDAAGKPLEDVTVTVPEHPEFGQTTTSDEGVLDMAVNGGQPLTVRYEKDGFIPVEREVAASWRDFSVAPEVVMLPYDGAVTTVEGSAPDVQVARATQVTDSEGSRRATLLFPAGTSASMELPDGSNQHLSQMSVRATEFTVGDSGERAMPAELPSASAYTYAVELSVDEAVAAGADTVTFNKPVAFYVENFLGFPTGSDVPVGHYDRERHGWVAVDDGRTIEIVSITDGMADLDVTGDGNADTGAELAALGITDAERAELLGLYQVGQSLWRARFESFSPKDLNLPGGLPQGAVSPEELEALQTLLRFCAGRGSIIGCESQTLGETIPVAGTPFHLRYDSSRVPGRKAERSLEIPLTSSQPPAPLKHVTLEVTVAGRTFSESFAPQANLTHTFTWDGKDAYGRQLHGRQTATVRIAYVYQGVYYFPAEDRASFGLPGEGPFQIPARNEFTLSQQYESEIGGLTGSSLQGLGGWTLSAHHSYDPDGRMLYLGSGERRSAEALLPQISVFAGNGDPGPANQGTHSGDGGQATAAGLSEVTGVAAAADGSLYIADSTNGVVRKVSPSGVISTFAGGGSPTGNGDGGPATDAELGTPLDVAVGDDGSVYIADGPRIRRVAPNGIITTFAGGGDPADGLGDGLPATEARLASSHGITTAPSGGLYIADTGNDRVRIVTADGIIRTYAGGGTPAGGLGDGLPALQARLSAPLDVALGRQGELYVSDNGHHRVRQISPQGFITTFAGTGVAGSSGDGGPATQAMISDPVGLAVDGDGSVYVVDRIQDRVRKVSSEDIITTAVGTGQAGFSGEQGPPAAARVKQPTSAAVAPDGDLYVSDTLNFRVRRVAPPLPGFSSGDIIVPEGETIYHFSSTGRHKRTLDALTGAVIYRFNYDGQGRLASVEDDFGDVTAIERDANGISTAIVSPDGLRTALTIEGGWLTQATNAEGEAVSMSYGQGGLLASFTTPSGSSSFTYDALGRLTLDEGPEGSSTALSRDLIQRGVRVTKTTAAGRVTSYETKRLASGAERRVITVPSGATVQATAHPDGSGTMTMPDGSQRTSVMGPDPRWGMSAPVVGSTVVTMASGKSLTISAARNVTLSDPADPLSLATQTDTITYAGDTYTRSYDNSTKTITETSAAGRTLKTTLNPKGLVIETRRANDDPVIFGYDLRGRLSTTSQGSGAAQRLTTLSYGSNGFLDGIVDPLQATSFVTDDVGRVLTLTRDDGNDVTFAYDDSGNLTSLTPPGKTIHGLDYRGDDQRERYRPPQVAGITDPSTSYSYNLDHELTGIDPPGAGNTSIAYDTGGRVGSVNWSGGTIGFTYDPTTSQLTSVSSPGGNSISYSYDGALVTGVSAAGAAAGSVTYDYGTDLRLSTRSIGGSGSVAYAYDDDGLLISAGPMNLSWSALEGDLAGTSVGGVATTYGYNSFGELTSYSADFSGSSLLSTGYSRDKHGRVKTLTETIGGQTTTYTYIYDDVGRLTDVEVGGSSVEHYEYDGNGNRTAATVNGSSVTGSYDEQDRMASYGDATYTYDAAGMLDTKAVTGQGTTDYDYDEIGNLTHVELADGTSIDYVSDGHGNRIAKKVDGAFAQRFLYGAGNRPVAEIDGSGAVVATFVYASRSHSPDLMVKDGVTYRIVSDHLGSPRLVANAATGEIAQRIDYDSFGNVTNDTNPGFQPFGFAGGLYDPDTGLVRFGARDYDPSIGRWTVKDPIDFAGGDPNLYAYVGNDPINYVDPDGTIAMAAAPVVLVVPEIAPVVVGGVVVVVSAVAGAFDGVFESVAEAIFPSGPGPYDAICQAATAIAHGINTAHNLNTALDGWLAAKEKPLEERPWTENPAYSGHGGIVRNINSGGPKGQGPGWCKRHPAKCLIYLGLGAITIEKIIHESIDPSEARRNP